MKKLWMVAILMVMGLSVWSQDKKEIKALEKKYNVYENGKMFKGANDVAILGANLRFKEISRATGQTSNKDEVWTKFGAYAMLDGISDEVYQSITDQYKTMLEEKFKAAGFNVRPYADITGTKSFAKLIEKSTMKDQNTKKSWGSARTFTPGDQAYLGWKFAAPFGPHLKVAKEMKSLLFNSLVTVEFCHIDVDVSQSSSSYNSLGTKHIYTEGSSKVTPVIRIDGYTYPLNGLEMHKDNSYNLFFDGGGNTYHTKLDLKPSEIHSSVDFATNIESCDGCTPASMQSAFKLMENTLQTVVIDADEKLFEKAVLDALQKYIDEVFVLYNYKRL